MIPPGFLAQDFRVLVEDVIADFDEVPLLVVGFAVGLAVLVGDPEAELHCPNWG